MYSDRIVSVFKDEPIVAAFLNGFFFIVIGYLFDSEILKKNFEKRLKRKLLQLMS